MSFESQFKEIEKEIISIVEKGNLLYEDKKYLESLEEYKAALRIVETAQENYPEYIEQIKDLDFESWIETCFYHTYMDMNKFDYAKEHALSALKTRSADIKTYELVNLGMVYYELNQLEEAYSFFSQAYDEGNKRAFRGENKKYLQFYLNKRKDII